MRRSSVRGEISIAILPAGAQLREQIKALPEVS
jgi:hypothetical protein